MTFAKGTKVRYRATISPLEGLNGLEGIVSESRPYDTTMIKVTKGSDSGDNDHIIGKVEGFSTSALVEVVDEPKEFKVGDRVKVNDPDGLSHHGLIGVITEVGSVYGGGTVKADVDESCEAFQTLRRWNRELDGKDFFLKASTLELVEEEKLKEGGAISYEQVERGQRIRVSYESKGVVHSREGIVGKVAKYKNAYGTKLKDNWTINVQDDEAERYGGKGQRLNWGSEKNKETIVLLEAAPEVDAVLERLLESKGGTVVRAFAHRFLVRDAFSDTWRDYSSGKSYSSETLRREAGDKIAFFVEDMEGN
jgi:hypothetical protein